MPPITKKDVFDALSEFHGKFIEPEFRSIRNKLGSTMKNLRICWTICVLSVSLHEIR